MRRAPSTRASALPTSVLPTPGLAFEQQRALQIDGEAWSAIARLSSAM